MENFIPMDYIKLTKQEILEALSSLVFLVDKFYGRIKAIGCIDERKT